MGKRVMMGNSPPCWAWFFRQGLPVLDPTCPLQPAPERTGGAKDRDAEELFERALVARARDKPFRDVPGPIAVCHAPSRFQPNSVLRVTRGNGA